MRTRILGRKGEITALLRGLKGLVEKQRAEVGQVANQVKENLDKAITGRINLLKDQELENRLEREVIDVTLPGLPFPPGGLHPLSRIMGDIREIFTGLGFSVAEGPEIERDYYNFEALNIPRDHPARDMQDSFYVNEEVLLRTHTRRCRSGPWKEWHRAAG